MTSAPEGHARPGPSLPGLLRRVLPQHPVVARLTVATFVNTFGNGLAMSVAALYFTRHVGIDAVHYGLALSVAAVAGVAVPLVSGRLGDRYGHRRTVLSATPLLGAVFLGYLFVQSFWALVVVAVLESALYGASTTARSALMLRVLPEDQRVRGRAYLRSVTNIGIACGGLVAAGALVVDRPWAYLAALGADGLTFFVVTAILVGLPDDRAVAPASVPAPGPAPAAAADAAPAPADAGARGVWRDGAYLGVSVVMALLSTHFVVLEVVVPLWVVQHTAAPRWAVSVLLLVNTVVVSLAQVPFSRGTDTTAGSSRAYVRGALALVAAMGLFALSAWPDDPVPALAVLVAAALVHVVGEMLTSAGQWGVQFGLTPHARAGEYQGVSSAGFSAAGVVGPTAGTALCIAGGPAGWAVIAAVYLVCGLLVPPLGRLGEARRRAAGAAPVEPAQV